MARYIPDVVTGLVSAVCGVAVRGGEPEEDEDDEDEEENVEMTAWDKVTNYFHTNEEVT